MTPALRPSRSRGLATGPSSGAITEASGALTIGATANEVETALPGDPEVLDVEDGEVGAAGLQQLRGVGRVAGLADLELDAGLAVEAARRRGVDPAVGRVRGEVEDQGRAL